jgi:hypothetical protein
MNDCECGLRIANFVTPGALNNSTSPKAHEIRIPQFAIRNLLLCLVK